MIIVRVICTSTKVTIQRPYSLLKFLFFLCRWEKDVGIVVEAAVRGAGGVTAARARLHAALLALHDPPAMHRMPALPYCGPGVRPGDVTMMPKTSEMSLLVSIFSSTVIKYDRSIMYLRTTIRHLQFSTHFYCLHLRFRKGFSF